MRRTVTLIALLPSLVAALVACAAPDREGVRLDVAASVSADQLDRVRDQVQARVDVLRPGTAVEIDATGVFVEMPSVEATPRFIADLTMPGRVAIVPVPIGLAPPAEGSALAAPLLIGPEGIAGGGHGLDPSGQPTLDIQLNPGAAELFRRWTAGNVGNPIAITVDGIVLSVPFVVEPIEDGHIQVSSGSPGAKPDYRGIVAALASGPMEVYLRGTPVTR